MGIMIIPFISSLSDGAITAVPEALRDGSYGLGAPPSETIRFVIIPAALPGIMGGFLLAFSRAIGETMIVVMAAGLAAIFGALVGSFLPLSITLALILPLGVATAVYLEEFAPKGRFTEFVEVNINNLAAVPSIVFGLLGLALFLGVAHLPRSAPLVGGLTLSLMTFSTIIITGRVSIQAVPPSIREAALGVGASPIQVVTHHVLPLAIPGILTGTVIGMARALGETAPLLMIGMVAFVVDIPTSVSDASTALPVQIFLWSDGPERAFVEKTSGAILVLLAFLIGMNGTAIGLRRHFEKKW